MEVIVTLTNQTFGLEVGRGHFGHNTLGDFFVQCNNVTLWGTYQAFCLEAIGSWGGGWDIIMKQGLIGFHLICTVVSVLIILKRETLQLMGRLDIHQHTCVAYINDHDNNEKLHSDYIGSKMYIVSIPIQVKRTNYKIVRGKLLHLPENPRKSKLWSYHIISYYDIIA